MIVRLTLEDMQRGSFSSTPPSGFGSRNFQQTWTLDSTGNWRGFVEKADGSTTSLDQTRDANRVNEITGIANSTGGDWTQPVYDAAGNMTLMPQPASPADGFAAVYDAWNRLVRIDDVSGESPVTVQENAYDGLTRRVSKTTFGESGEIRHYYYDIDWRVIQEYVGATPNRSNREDWDRIYAWGLRYIDELALRLRAVEGEDPEALVALQDANWNVTAICDGTAAVVERYAYTAYGTPTFQDDTFAQLSPDESAYNWETLYPGYRFDAETQLYHVRFRELHSSLGRWLTRDPVGAVNGAGEIGHTAFWNPEEMKVANIRSREIIPSAELYSASLEGSYRYVGDSGFSNVDPFGLARICTCAMSSEIASPNEQADVRAAVSKQCRYTITRVVRADPVKFPCKVSVSDVGKIACANNCKVALFCNGKLSYEEKNLGKVTCTVEGTFVDCALCGAGEVNLES